MLLRWIALRSSVVHINKVCSSRISINDNDIIVPKLKHQDEVSVPHHRPKISSALKHLSDRFMISATFPDNLAQNLTEFDQFDAKIYAGFDPTSASLHIGNLLTLNGLLHLYDAGFEILILIGGATCKLGDPSGRKEDRSPLDWSTIKSNSESIAEQIKLIFENYTKYIAKGDKSRLNPVRFFNNARWYSDLNVIDFLDCQGRQFRVKHLLEKQAIKSRLSETGMNLNEFLYQIFQAYDFLRLYDDHGCLLQFGGSDQVGNVHAGHDLIRKLRGKSACGIFAPLLTDDQGEKLGKSLDNSVCLDPRHTSPFHFYQHFVRLHDTVMQKYMYLLTFLSTDEIDRLCAKHMKSPEQRLAQKTLAENVTLLVHGQAGLESALKTTQILYNDKIEHLLDIPEEEITRSFKDIPIVRLAFRPDYTALELVLATERFNSEQEAEFWIRRGSVYVNSIKVQEPQCIMVRDCHVLRNGLTLLKFGKKGDCYLIRWSSL